MEDRPTDDNNTVRKCIFWISFVSYVPIHFILIESSIYQYLVQDASASENEDIDFSFLSVLLWLPAAIYLPRFVIELTYYYIKPTLSVDFNITLGIVFEFVLWNIFQCCEVIYSEKECNKTTIFTFTMVFMVFISGFNTFINLNVTYLISILPNHYSWTNFNSQVASSIFCIIF